MHKVVSCNEVYKWPEFQALMKRLGVDLDKANIYLQITLDQTDQDRDKPVTVRQSYLGVDSGS